MRKSRKNRNISFVRKKTSNFSLIKVSYGVMKKIIPAALTSILFFLGTATNCVSIIKPLKASNEDFKILKSRLAENFFPLEIEEPYPPLSGGSFSGSHVSESPDPLITYRWETPAASDDLQIYVLKPVSFSTKTPSSFQNLDSLIEDSTYVTVNGTGSIRFDFGITSAAWLEFQSEDFSGSVEMSISEYNEPAVVSTGSKNRIKTLAPQKYGNFYRLELNDQLYEGVRFGWIHIRTFSEPWHITNVRLVCQTKPTNYNGSFSCSDSRLTQIWYVGAYTVKLNLLKDYIGAILMERGDRHSWTGDAYPAQAASMVAFANYDFVRMNIERTADVDNNIESYSLYWILSLVDYYKYSGDQRFFEDNILHAQGKLDKAYSLYGTNPPLGFYGWDERLGAGQENPDTEECQNAYKMLFIRTCREFAWALDQTGRKETKDYYNSIADEKIEEIRSDTLWHTNFDVHACADALNAGFLRKDEQQTLFEREFSDPNNRISYSPFNQYFIIQALANINRHNEAISTTRRYWGGQIDLGGTSFFEVYRPDWNLVLERNDPIPNNQCGYTSLTHPWSAGVTKWLSEEVLGIKPTTPGFSTFDILPHLGSSLTSVSGKVLSPYGEISASFDVSTGICNMSSPPGTLGRIGIPKAGKIIDVITINGELAWSENSYAVSAYGDVSEDENFVYFSSLESGKYDIIVSYRGTTPPFSEFAAPYSAEFLGIDSTTSGNWGEKYGKDGYVLCSYNTPGNDIQELPLYVSFIEYRKNWAAQWAVDSNDYRALSPNHTNSYPRNAGCIYTGDPLPTYQTMTVDIGISQYRDFQVALYFVDWDHQDRRIAVELFDYSSKKLIQPVKIIPDFRGGKYLIYEYNKSVRFRINQVRGINAVLSGIFFDSSGQKGIINLNKTKLYYGAVIGGPATGSQEFIISNAGTGVPNWTVTPLESWIQVTPESGTGNGVVTVSVNPQEHQTSSHYAQIAVYDTNALNSPQFVDVYLTMKNPYESNPPFGSFDTPLDRTSEINGSVPLSGWALDDIGMTGVRIYRNPVIGDTMTEGNGLVYIGEALFVEGARPDVELSYPTYPQNSRAGWGYMMLTNFLPGQGNGTYVLFAKATDKEGNEILLGQKTITCDNANAVKPFGTIDTPQQGEEISGLIWNHGWALTPLSNTIPTDGSTINVWIDGKKVGKPDYNQHRNDIATLFPGYNNTAGAAGAFLLDTSLYANGVHTIAWSVQDNAGNSDGIGSRFFSVQNLSGSINSFPTGLSQKLNMGVDESLKIAVDPESGTPETAGENEIVIEQLERIELHLKSKEGLLFRGWGRDRSKGLPIGSTLDREKGIFTWMPGPGFLGQYVLHFAVTDGVNMGNPITIQVFIVPKTYEKVLKRRKKY